MPKVEKEFILNYTMNRWQLNFKKNVGPTSDSIRECVPDSIQEWEIYYYNKIRSREHIQSLGKNLYDRIKNTLPDEKRFHPELLGIITEQDCLDYMHNIVITRTYNGYERERGR
jgi:chemotaxis regulatin CheY-phosphate phosphatase CheZ